MDTVSQSCPSCKSSKYNNPQLRLMVNICGHSLCENCVDVLFVRGSGLCVQCKTPIRKVNFRYQLFEDPAVQKEVDIRKKILNEYNKREDDFDTMEEYDLYLEMVEDIIYQLVNDIDAEKIRKTVEQYKKDNKELIKRNRTKQSSSNEFYEMELEHERLQREKREKAEAEDSAAEVLRRQRLLAAKTLEGFYSGGAVNLPEVLREATVNATSSTVAATSLDSAIASIPPPPRSEVAITSGGPKNVLESKHRFLPPPSGTALPRNAPASSFAMPPPTSAMRWGAVPPSSAAFITPASGFVGISPGVPGGVIGGPGWVGPDFYAPGQPRKVQEDTVVLRKPKQSKLAPKAVENNASVVNPTIGAAQGQRTLKQWLAPYAVELCGPQPPTPEKSLTRWPDLESVYLHCVVEPLTASVDEPKPSENSATMETEDSNGAPQEERRRGISHALPRGTCGIAPNVFLTRALQDSRCGLFI